GKGMGSAHCSAATLAAPGHLKHRGSDRSKSRIVAEDCLKQPFFNFKIAGVASSAGAAFSTKTTIGWLHLPHKFLVLFATKRTGQDPFTGDLKKMIQCSE